MEEGLLRAKFVEKFKIKKNLQQILTVYNFRMPASQFFISV